MEPTIGDVQNKRYGNSKNFHIMTLFDTISAESHNESGTTYNYAQEVTTKVFHVLHLIQKISFQKTELNVSKIQSKTTNIKHGKNQFLMAQKVAMKHDTIFKKCIYIQIAIKRPSTKKCQNNKGYHNTKSAGQPAQK